jgi:hypothetical protein
VEVRLHIFLISALDGGEYSASLDTTAKTKVVWTVQMFERDTLKSVGICIHAIPRIRKGKREIMNLESRRMTYEKSTTRVSTQCRLQGMSGTPAGLHPHSQIWPSRPPYHKFIIGYWLRRWSLFADKQRSNWIATWGSRDVPADTSTWL